MEKVILLAFLLFGAVCSMDYEHCEKNEGAVPSHFYIHMCHSTPCNFKGKNETTGIVKFIAAEEINRIDMEVHVDREGSKETFAGEGVHKCSGFESDCKYEAGTKVNYYFLLPVFIESMEEKVVQFKMILKNANGAPLTCAKFNAKIGDGVTPELPLPDYSEEIHDSSIDDAASQIYTMQIVDK